MSIKFQFQLNKSYFSLSVNGEISSRGITAVYGPSGSGKTTFLRALAGLEPAVKGTLEVEGEVWLDENTHLPPHRRAIGYVFQQGGLFPHLNVMENILFGRKRRKGSMVDVAELIDLLDLAPLTGRSTTNLSGGEQQRVAIARALASNPRMLLLDEPMASLDQGRKNDIMPFLEKLHESLTIPIILVSHSQREVGHLADNMVVISHGQIIAQGATKDVMVSPELDLFCQEDAMAILKGEVLLHEPQHALSLLSTSAGDVWVKQLPFSEGQSVRLQVLARDVSVTLQKPQGSSILNVFPGTISQMIAIEGAQVMLKIQCGNDVVLSRITGKSQELLDLKQGMEVFAQVKGIAVLS